MPFSWNNVNTHVAGDVLPLADWNQAATALNSMVGTWVTSGTTASTGINATPPFYCWFGSANVTTNVAGYFSLTVPNGGFPNGIIFQQASAWQTSGSFNIEYSNFSPSTKTTANWIVYSSLGTSPTTLNSTAINISFMVIGY